MSHLDPGSQIRVFDFAEVTHVYPFTQVSPGAQVAESGHIYTVFDDGFLDQCRPDLDIVADLRILDDAIGPQHAAFSDHSFAFQIGVGQQSGVFADFYTFFNIH